MLKSSTFEFPQILFKSWKFGSEKQRILHTRELYGTNM